MHSSFTTLGLCAIGAFVFHGFLKSAFPPMFSNKKPVQLLKQKVFGPVLRFLKEHQDYDPYVEIYTRASRDQAYEMRQQLENSQQPIRHIAVPTVTNRRQGMRRRRRRRRGSLSNLPETNQYNPAWQLSNRIESLERLNANCETTIARLQQELREAYDQLTPLD